MILIEVILSASLVALRQNNLRKMRNRATVLICARMVWLSRFTGSKPSEKVRILLQIAKWWFRAFLRKWPSSGPTGFTRLTLREWPSAFLKAGTNLRQRLASETMMIKAINSACFNKGTVQHATRWGVGIARRRRAAACGTRRSGSAWGRPLWLMGCAGGSGSSTVRTSSAFASRTARLSRRWRRASWPGRSSQNRRWPSR